MSFTYDLTTDIGMIRMHIGDQVQDAGVRPSGANFSDEELTAVLNNESNVVMRAVAAAFEILMSEWAREPDYMIGPRRESTSQVSKRYGELAAIYRTRYGGSGTSFSVGFVRDDAYANPTGDESLSGTELSGGI